MMKAASVKELREELNRLSPKQLVEICLRLSRFKKENKELLTYLLFESNDEEAYVRMVKKDIDRQFEEVNTRSYYLIKKSVRKILRNTRKYIRYSPRKDTEVELLLYFCRQLKQMDPSYKRSSVLSNLYDRLIDSIYKKVEKLHEDLQYDYERELREM
jgi:hypothetical protein